jgi:hypothetical protein
MLMQILSRKSQPPLVQAGDAARAVQAVEVDLLEVQLRPRDRHGEGEVLDGSRRDEHDHERLESDVALRKDEPRARFPGGNAALDLELGEVLVHPAIRLGRQQHVSDVRRLQGREVLRVRTVRHEPAGGGALVLDPEPDRRTSFFARSAKDTLLVVRTQHGDGHGDVPIRAGVGPREQWGLVDGLRCERRAAAGRKDDQARGEGEGEDPHGVTNNRSYEELYE